MRAAYLTLLALWAPPAAALELSTDPAAVFAEIERLLGTAVERRALALPEDRHWRAPERLRVVLHGANAVRILPAAGTVAEELRRATGIDIGLRVVPKAHRPAADAPPPHLRIYLLPSKAAARRAGELGFAGGVGSGFRFLRDPLLGPGVRLGAVVIAEDAPKPAVETALVQALVRAVGTAAPDNAVFDTMFFDDLMMRPAADEAFRVLYDPAMAAGLPLAEVRARARRILELTQ